MTRSGTSWRRPAIRRDARGRLLFVPWYPWWRGAWVLPGEEEATAFGRRLLRWVLFWLAAGAVLGLLVAHARAPGWSPYLLVAVMLLHHAWWIRGATRGLERTRYERPRKGAG